MTVALVDILTATYPAPRLLTHRYCGKIIKQLNVGVICYAVIIDNASLFFFFLVYLNSGNCLFTLCLFPIVPLKKYSYSLHIKHILILCYTLQIFFCLLFLNLQSLVYTNLKFLSKNLSFNVFDILYIVIRFCLP